MGGKFVTSSGDVNCFPRKNRWDGSAYVLSATVSGPKIRALLYHPVSTYVSEFHTFRNDIVHLKRVAHAMRLQRLIS